MFQRTSVGLDVHALSVVACAIVGQTGEKFNNDYARITAEFSAGCVRCRAR